MLIILVKIVSAFRRILCHIFGHVVIQVRDGQLIDTVCKRCGTLESVDQILYTARAKVTRGEIEERMAAHPPEGYRFVSMNSKKRKACFESASGELKFVSV